MRNTTKIHNQQQGYATAQRAVDVDDFFAFLFILAPFFLPRQPFSGVLNSQTGVTVRTVLYCTSYEKVMRSICRQFLFMMHLVVCDKKGSNDAKFG